MELMPATLGGGEERSIYQLERTRDMLHLGGAAVVALSQFCPT